MFKFGKKNRKFRSLNERLLAEQKFEDFPSDGIFLFDDGSIGEIVRMYEFDPYEVVDDYYLDEDEEEVNPKYLKEGVEPEQLYINYYMPDGSYIDSGCYWYWKNETVREYCERNGESIPVKQLPDEVWKVLESRDTELRKKLLKEVPELKNFDVGKW